MPPAVEAQNVNHWTTGEIPKKTVLILWCSTLKSTVVQYNQHEGAGIEQPGKKITDWMSLEEGEEVGNGRAEGSSAIGGGRQAAVSLTPDI